jgi:hypothetical protein
VIDMRTLVALMTVLAMGSAHADGVTIGVDATATRWSWGKGDPKTMLTNGGELMLGYHSGTHSFNVRAGAAASLIQVEDGVSDGLFLFHAGASAQTWPSTDVVLRGSLLYATGGMPDGDGNEDVGSGWGLAACIGYAFGSGRDRFVLALEPTLFIFDEFQPIGVTLRVGYQRL